MSEGTSSAALGMSFVKDLRQVATVADRDASLTVAGFSIELKIFLCK